ncbi:MAG: NAD-dependent epimerase/dehydratase family protein [Bacteroidota bacterium]
MILLTGGSGFLGRHIVKELLEANYEVRLLMRNPEGRSFPWQNMVEIVEGDILDILALEKAMKGVTKVIHAAAQVSFSRGEHESLRQTNIDGTANVVNACLTHSVERLIHVSSVSAIGKPGKRQKQIITETLAWNPALNNSEYGASKYKAELEVYRGVAEGLSATMINPAFIIGPSHDWDNGTAKIFSIIDKGLRFYNQGVGGYVGVGDVARAVRILLESEQVEDGERFLMSAENLSYHAVFTMVAEAINRPAPRYGVPNWLALFIGRVSELLSRISGRDPIVSLETMRAGIKKHYYDGSKLEQLGFSYTPIKDVIQDAGAAYLEVNQEE